MEIPDKKRVKPRKKMTPERKAFIAFCCVGPVLGWLVFYVYVNFTAFGMAFQNKDGMFTLENFVRFYNDLTQSGTELRLAFRNTFIAFSLSFVQYPITVLVAYFIYKKVPGSAIYRLLLMLPGMILGVAISMAQARILGVNGAIAELVRDIANLDYTPELLADSKFANTTVMALMVWAGMGGNLIIWGGTFARIPDELLEVGRLDGTNWWTELIHIITPMVWPTVGLQMVLMFCGIFNAGGNVFLLTQGRYGTQTFSNWMYMQVYGVSGGTASSNIFNYMSAVGMCISVVAIALSRVVRKISDSMFDEVEF